LYADLVYPSKGWTTIAVWIGHFFAAIDIDAFRPKEGFKLDMDDLIHDFTMLQRLVAQNAFIFRAKRVRRE